MTNEIRRSVLHRIAVTHQDGIGRQHVCVDVNDSGLIEIVSTHGFGDINLNAVGEYARNWKNRQAVYDFLTEDELAVWRNIGPEDSEIFATTKLDPEWGIEV